MPAHFVGVIKDGSLGFRAKSKQAECHEHHTHTPDYEIDSCCHGTPPLLVSITKNVS